jgi:leucyl aminopeptidase
MNVDIARTAPKDVDAIGVPVGTDGAVPRSLGLSRARLAEHGFEGKVGQTFVLAGATGPTLIAVGTGPASERTPSTLRTSAAALARAAGKRTSVATSLADGDGARAAAQAVVEGVTLASYKFTNLKSDKGKPGLSRLVLTVGPEHVVAATAGAQRGQVTADAVALARDLANLPPAHLTARKMADKAVEIAGATGLTIEVMGKAELEALGCGGILGVNQGSVEPPRLVKLVYTPRNPSGTWRSSARASCTTPAASRSSRRTACT